MEIEGQVQKEFTVTSPEQSKIAVIPHHLKSKAAGANSLKKGARILAVGLFTVKEHCSCMVSGSINKSKQDNKRPQFEPHRMALIHGKCFEMKNKKEQKNVIFELSPILRPSLLAFIS